MMGWSRRFDAWAGRVMFHPPIIAACQLAGISQHQFSRWAAALTYLFAAYAVWPFAFATFLFGAYSLINVLAAVYFKNLPISSDFWLRMIVWGFIAGLIVAFILTNDRDFLKVIGFEIGLLFSMYAATIRTIPPKEIREGKMKEAFR